MQTITENEEQLDRLNGVLKRGPVQHSLNVSLILIAVTGLGLLSLGGFLYWLLYLAWIQFVSTFGMGLILWQEQVVEKTYAVRRELKSGTLAREGKPTRADYASALAILIVLLLPGAGVSHWLWNKPDSIVIVKTQERYGSSETLHIPSGYIIDDLSTLYWKGVFGQAPETTKLFVIMDDMRPLAREVVKQARLLEYKEFSPVANYRDLLEVQLFGSSEAYKAMAKQYKPFSIQGDASQRIIFRGKPKDEFGLHMEDMLNYIVGVPEGKLSDDLMIVCQRTCSMLVNIKPLSMAKITFHKSRLSDWRVIHEQATLLIKSFVYEKDQ